MGRLGDPCSCNGPLAWGKARAESIRRVLGAGESERPIVAMKRGNARGGEGALAERSGLKENWS